MGETIDREQKALVKRVPKAVELVENALKPLSSNISAINKHVDSLVNHDFVARLNSIGINLIAEAYVAGASLIEVAEMCGVTPVQIKLWIEEDQQREEVIKTAKDAVADIALYKSKEALEGVGDVKDKTAMSKAHLNIYKELRRGRDTEDDTVVHVLNIVA